MQNKSQNKDKSDIINEYSETEQGSLVGRGNELINRAENIKDDNKDFTNALDSPPLEETKHGEMYGTKEYHGI